MKSRGSLNSIQRIQASGYSLDGPGSIQENNWVGIFRLQTVSGAMGVSPGELSEGLVT